MSDPRGPDRPRRSGPPPRGRPRPPESSEPDTVPIPIRRRYRGQPPPPVDPGRRTVQAPGQRLPRPGPPAPPWYLDPVRRPRPSARPPAPPPGASPDSTQARPAARHSQRPLLVGAALAVLFTSAVAVVILTVGLGRLRFLGATGPSELDVNAAQAGVRQILTDPINGYGRDNVTDITCNNGSNPTIRAGGGFSCEVVVDGANRQVAVVFTDNAGTYEVDRPR